MEHFIERLDTLLDNDPFSDMDWNLLSPNDYEVSSLYFINFFFSKFFFLLFLVIRKISFKIFRWTKTNTRRKKNKNRKWNQISFSLKFFCFFFQFEEIMEDLLQELSHKPDISSFYRTLDDPLLTTVKKNLLFQILQLSFYFLFNQEFH